MQPGGCDQSPMTAFYEIEVPDEKAATYKVVTFIIALINLFAFAVANMHAAPLPGMLFTGMGVGTAAVLFFVLQPRFPLLKSFRIEIAFIICGIVWMATGNYLPGALLVLFAFLGFATNRKPVISFSKEYIVYPSFPVKKIGWADVDFVILKDDILTIELLDNKLMQFTLNKPVASAIDAGRFNQFCNECKSAAIGSSQPN
jgi:hypothetical protein